MAKVKMDYKKMTLESMLDWLEEKNKSEEERIEFAQTALVINEEGNRIKKTRDAKAYFYKTYKDEIEFLNAPKPKPKKRKIDDRLAELVDKANGKKSN